MAAIAVEAWDERWTTPDGRADRLVPHPAVAALVPVLKACGTKHVLDLGCGVGRQARQCRYPGYEDLQCKPNVFRGRSGTPLLDFGGAQ